jgi:hypothetical protein
MSRNRVKRMKQRVNGVKVVPAMAEAMMNVRTCRAERDNAGYLKTIEESQVSAIKAVSPD